MGQIANQHKIGSINYLLRRPSPDLVKVKLLIELSNQLLYLNPDEGIANGLKALSLASRHHRNCGHKKIACDIWCDTVNLASRMESSGEPGKVNISESTYDHIRDQFRCEYRGRIQAKNKGEVEMYFVEPMVELVV